MTTVNALLAAVNAAYPLARAEAWDRVGLQIGDGAAQVVRVLAAYEVTDAVIDEAADCQALLVYHPPLFRPLNGLNFSDPTARLAARCIRAGLNVMAAHTALDNAAAPHALGDRLAAALGLREVQILAPSGHEELCKIVVFVPADQLDQVREAMWAAGAGSIGLYDRAGFAVSGQGSFRPLPGAEPFCGTVNSDSQVAEWRLEVIAPLRLQAPVLAAMRAAHCYQEVACDVYKLVNVVAPYGAARYGEIEPMPPADFAQSVQRALGAPALRLVQGATSTVRRIACAPGSGSGYIEAAARAGCHCLVTGDIKHHDALKAQALGLSVIDATHAATEVATTEMLAEAAASCAATVVRSRIDTNPFAALQP